MKEIYLTYYFGGQKAQSQKKKAQSLKNFI